MRHRISQSKSRLIARKVISYKYLLTFVVIFAGLGGYFVWRGSALYSNESNPQTTWATCNLNANNTSPSTFTPLSDAAAAALVTHEPETRSKNATAYSINGTNYPAPNYYVPANSELTDFHTAAQWYPYGQYVDGQDGLTRPSTDDLIQWGAHKWGIPEDWLRAQYVAESHWNQYAAGDRTTETAADYPLYPIQSRVSGSTTDVYESLGITQLKWRPADHPGGSSATGSEPVRWKSTAFNIDYQASIVRFFYDNPQQLRSSWGDASYVPCQQWNSLGGWVGSNPWGNSTQENYINAVQTELNNQSWATSGFPTQSLTIPAAITFNSNGSGSAPGDCNYDGHVTVFDLSTLLSHYSQAYVVCDFNVDGAVTILDLSTLLSHYGT